MKWNLTDIKYENHEKKKVTDCVQDTKPKDQAKGSTKGGGKIFLGPTYDTSISHLDPMIFNCQHIIELSQ